MTNKLTKKDINKVYVRNLFGYQWKFGTMKKCKDLVTLG